MNWNAEINFWKKYSYIVSKTDPFNVLNKMQGFLFVCF